MCSKKDYVAVAKAIRRNTQECMEQCSIQDIPSRIAREVADHFAKDNARFDRERFLAACGVAQ